MKKILALCLLLFSACSTSLRDDDCRNLDWELQGKRDSAQGLSKAMFSTYKKNCIGKESAQKQLNLYTLGYSKGIKNYCNYKTGRLLGEANAVLSKVCDLKKYPRFLEGYRQGLKIGKKKALQKKGL